MAETQTAEPKQQCQCCLEQRKQHRQAPRDLMGFDLVNFGKPFMKKKDPIFICSFCDGASFDGIIGLLAKLNPAEK